MKSSLQSFTKSSGRINRHPVIKGKMKRRRRRRVLLDL
jgi:hypothetical protein